MPDILRELEKAYEAKYKLDEELRFKVRSRSKRNFGVWASGQLGMTGEDAERYAHNIVNLDLDTPKPEVVLETVAADFTAAEVRVGEDELKSAYLRFYAEAVEQVCRAYPTPLDTDHVRVGG